MRPRDAQRFLPDVNIHPTAGGATGQPKNLLDNRSLRVEVEGVDQFANADILDRAQTLDGRYGRASRKTNSLFIFFELALSSWSFGFITSGLRIFFFSGFFVSGFFGSRSGLPGLVAPAVRRKEPQAQADQIRHRPIAGNDILRAVQRAGLHSENTFRNHIVSCYFPCISIGPENTLRGDRPSQSQPPSAPGRQPVG